MRDSGSPLVALHALGFWCCARITFSLGPCPVRMYADVVQGGKGGAAAAKGAAPVTASGRTGGSGAVSGAMLLREGRLMGSVPARQPWLHALQGRQQPCWSCAR